MNRKNKKLKGTVLFTVVSVMSILLIFLLSTLVLAASTNNRTHKTYASTQTEYAARTAIESFFAAMETNAEIAKAVEGLGDEPIYPTVNISSKGFGDIFCYDEKTGDVRANQIKVELIEGQTQYIYNKKAPGVDAGWSEYDPVKITACASLGKEESSISVYIRKKSPYEIEPSNIKGLQTVGMSKFESTKTLYTGGAGIGVCEPFSDANMYKITNDPIFETDFTYINGSLDGATQMQIKATKYGTGTVIMGNANLKNPGDGGSLVWVDYALPTDEEGKERPLTQQDVPYLYVDKELSFTDACHITAPTNLPFNLFCGSINTGANNAFIDADIYLMDKSATSVLGSNDKLSTLKSWTKSVVTQTPQKFKSEGGNIFCKGNLTLNNMCVYGDVRVCGDLTVDYIANAHNPHSTLTDVEAGKSDGAKIEGDIIVGGVFAFDNDFLKNHNGKIVYCANYSFNGGEVQAVNSTITQNDGTEGGNAIILQPLSEWGKFEDIYPPDMERNVINGSPDAKIKNKIIKQLDEIRAELNCEVENVVDDDGNVISKTIFDPNIYFTDFPVGEEVDETHVYTKESLPDSESDESDANYTNADGIIVISENCTFEGAFPDSLKIKIEPSGKKVWIKFKNAKFDSNLTIDIANYKDDKNKSVVNFIVENYLWLEKLQMTTSNVVDGASVEEDTYIGVYWYGNDASNVEVPGLSGPDEGKFQNSVIYVQNGGSFIGTAKAPYTHLVHKTNATFNKITYKGEEIEYPTWVGSALFYTVDVQNQFKLLYSGAGSSGDDIDTAVGDYKIMYFDH